MVFKRLSRIVLCVVLTVSLIVPASDSASAVTKKMSVSDALLGTYGDQNETQSDGSEKLEPYGETVENDGVSTIVYDEPSVTLPKKATGTYGASNIPSKYDLRKKGQSTSVKDQKDENNCWAFSTMASLESNLIKSGLVGSGIDLSEAHLAWFNFKGKSPRAVSKYAGKDYFINHGEGSNHYDSAATLARGYGAIRESVMPYSYWGTKFFSTYQNDKYRVKHTFALTNAEFMSIDPTVEMSSSASKYATVLALDKAGMNTVKKRLMAKGALATLINMGDGASAAQNYKDCFGTSKPSEMTSYYYTGIVPNHTVTLIGWDDTYSKSNFKSGTPKGDGAWLVKNSWGSADGNESLHDDGYFWVSYYSPSVFEFTSFQGEKTSGRAIYQYDGVGLGDNEFYAHIPIKAANVFKARSDMLIDRVATWTSESDMSINVKIYVNKPDASPASGTLLYNKTFKRTYAGFHTINLKKSVGIPKGSKFSVVLSSKTEGNIYFYPFETKVLRSTHINPAPLLKGQSFVKHGSEKWTDVSKMGYHQRGHNKYKIYNALIKAYSKKSGKAKQKIKARKKITIKRGKMRRIGARRVKGNGKLVYRTTNSKVVTVTKAGVIKAKKRGKASIVINTLPTLKCRAAKKTVKVVVK